MTEVTSSQNRNIYLKKICDRYRNRKKKSARVFLVLGSAHTRSRIYVNIVSKYVFEV